MQDLVHGGFQPFTGFDKEVTVPLPLLKHFLKQAGHRQNNIKGIFNLITQNAYPFRQSSEPIGLPQSSLQLSCLIPQYSAGRHILMHTAK